MTEERTSYAVTPAGGGAGAVVTTDHDAAFADFLRLNVSDGDASALTVSAYKSRVSHFVAWCDQSLDHAPGNASEDDLRRYRKHLIDAGKSKATIAAYLQAVRRFFDAAVWRGLRVDNPAQGIKAPKDRTDAAEVTKYLPLAGLQKLLDAPDTNTDAGLRDRAIIVLMAKHGLRVAEVAALKVDDLLLSGEGQSWIKVTGKGDKVRSIPLTDGTVTVLEAWLQVRPLGANDGRVFVALGNRWHGRPISERSIRRMVDGHLESLNLKAEGISCHSLRHSAATWAIYAGAKGEAVQDMLGHASYDTTRRYAKIVDKMQENPALKLEALLGS